MIGVSSKGNFDKTNTFLNKLQSKEIYSVLDRYGDLGVQALSLNTPKDTGLTSESWSYRINRDKGSTSIEWYNSNATRQGTPIVILLQYGHGTGNGGYVMGQDFINPAIRPIFESIAEAVWKEVVR